LALSLVISREQIGERCDGRLEATSASSRRHSGVPVFILAMVLVAIRGTDRLTWVFRGAFSVNFPVSSAWCDLKYFPCASVFMPGAVALGNSNSARF